MRMERMWRKVNQGLSGRSSSKAAAAAIQSTDTASSAGFGDPQVVVAVAGTMGSTSGGAGGSVPSSSIVLGTSTATGRRLASSGLTPGSAAPTQPNSFSQHVISTASSERRRKRRRKSRPRRNGDSRLFSSGVGPRNESCETGAVGAPSGPPPSGTTTTSIAATGSAAAAAAATTTTTTTGPADPSLRQRAVAKLRMFNFHLNWDLHMTQCKPCGPRSSGNILTRRLCRNRRREDNELYRSNSFKFERFERKEGSEVGADTLQKKAARCQKLEEEGKGSFDGCMAN